MRTIEKTITLYKFDELLPHIQENILESRINNELEFYIDTQLYVDMVNEATEVLKTHFPEAQYSEVYYDLSYSQGSGSMIAFKISLPDLNKKYNVIPQDYKQTDDSYTMEDIMIDIYHNNNFYYHEQSFGIDWSATCDYDLDIMIDELVAKARKDIVRMNQELTTRGYNLIEDKELFKELALNYLNELEFTEDGEIYV